MPIPSGYLRATFFIQTPRGQWSSTLYYQPTAPWTDATDATAIAASFMDFFTTPIKSVLSENAKLVGFHLRYTSTAHDLEGFSTADAVDGNVSGECFPDQDCVEIRRLTGKPGRNKRGRIFISGVSEEFGQDGLLNSVAITQLQNLASALGQDLSFEQVYHARHWDRKLNVMDPITQCKALNRMVSRRDRARQLPYQAV